jgi:hypothetical protein
MSRIPTGLLVDLSRNKPPIRFGSWWTGDVPGTMALTKAAKSLVSVHKPQARWVVAPGLERVGPVLLFDMGPQSAMRSKTLLTARASIIAGFYHCISGRIKFLGLDTSLPRSRPC